MMRHNSSFQDRRLHHVFFVPELSYMARNLITQKLKSKTILKTLESLPIRIYPVYNDFFTLLMDSMLPKVLINNVSYSLNQKVKVTEASNSFVYYAAV